MLRRMARWKVLNPEAHHGPEARRRRCGLHQRGPQRERLQGVQGFACTLSARRSATRQWRRQQQRQQQQRRRQQQRQQQAAARVRPRGSANPS